MFAQECGLNKGTVWGYWHGRSLPGMRNLLLMCEQLGITANDMYMETPTFVEELPPAYLAAIASEKVAKGSKSGRKRKRKTGSGSGPMAWPDRAH
jgi:transcriptional regulator with XRE-family HTH domain